MGVGHQIPSHLKSHLTQYILTYIEEHMAKKSKASDTNPSNTEPLPGPHTAEVTPVSEVPLADRLNTVLAGKPTCDKAAEIIRKGDCEPTGLILRHANGDRTIVELAAVRRITKDESWALMHPSLASKAEIADPAKQVAKTTSTQIKRDCGCCLTVSPAPADEVAITYCAGHRRRTEQGNVDVETFFAVKIADADSGRWNCRCMKCETAFAKAWEYCPVCLERIAPAPASYAIEP